MKIQKALVLISSILVSCGQLPIDDKNIVNTAFYEENNSYVSGYIANAFDVVIDGDTYKDSEDYYTKKLEQLTDEAAKAGYDGWKLSFEAEIGLDDLKDGMTVFVSASGNRGFAGQEQMSFDGSFNFKIPDNAKDAVYSIRANKKVSITLYPPDYLNSLPKKWCFNFSANLNGITVDNPVILNTFESRVTKYACSLNINDGIKIPSDNHKE